ncbi:RNA polymerase ECF-type sigma factor SigD [Gordonia rubripertincta NBRC 101908]|uniref:RNA polymerase ECF-type sigma factor SigD n=1 Tax=Gordonia rubripertincta NBRC 101908 TaxID=1077975 RepID=A0ABQ0HWN5_GORRU|nr:RNA polymerase ECF-type sigma factor SigD [Gordonia rubripertincta NBRC 101908]
MSTVAAHKVADAIRVEGQVKSDPAENLPETVAGAGDPERAALDADATRRMRQLLTTLPEKAA